MRGRRASAGEPSGAAAPALAQLRRDMKRWAARADPDGGDDWERACTDFLRHAAALATASAEARGAPPRPSLTLAPASFVRIVYLVRHAEARHNVGDATAVDPPLTARGRASAAALRRLRVDAVVASPQRRALETAAIACDKGGAAAAGAWWRRGARPPPTVRLLSHALLRETNAGLPSDAVAPDTAAAFPRFERVASAAGTAATAAARSHTRASPEPAAVAAARAADFLAWLAMQRHARVAVVSHGGLLSLLLAAFGHDLGARSAPALRSSFALGEARAFAMTDLHGCVEVEVDE
jgi:broad specificity phosphatase PhoE